MPSHEFQFDLRVDAAEDPYALSIAVATEILRHVGYDAAAEAELAAAIRAALRELSAPGEACTVTFKAAAGELEVVVSGGSHQPRRITCPLPR